MQLLVNYDGIDLDVQDLERSTALIIASKKGDAQIVRLLLERRANVLTSNRRGFTPLHYAVEENHAEVVGLLLSHDPQIDLFATSNDGKTSWNMPGGKLSETWNKDVQWMLRNGGRLLAPSLAFNNESPPELRSSPSFPFFQMLVSKAVSTVAAEGIQAKMSDSLFISLEIQIFLSFTENLKRRQTIDPGDGYRSQDVDLKEQVEEEYARGLSYTYYFNNWMKDQLIEWEHDYNKKPWNLTLLHVTVYYGFDNELRKLLTVQKIKESINSREKITQRTALDLAVSLCNTNAIRILLKEKTLTAAEVGANVTPLEIAVEMRSKKIFGNVERWKGIEGLLTERADVQRYVDNLYRDRQVYVDAANAILVGAALIASVTFAGWLQPPLGYTTYYQEFYSYPAPPGTTESFAGVEQHLSIRVFWAFNSLSFFSAIATVVAGARTVLPSTGKFIKQEVRVVRKWLMFTSTLLTVSISCVLGAFTAAGIAVLPPIPKYRNNMMGTTLVGLVLCLVVLSAFLQGLYVTIRPWLAKVYYVVMFKLDI